VTLDAIALLALRKNAPAVVVVVSDDTNCFDSLRVAIYVISAPNAEKVRLAVPAYTVTTSVVAKLIPAVMLMESFAGTAVSKAM